MTNTSSLPPLEQERSLYSLQPALVIGLGELGWQIKQEWKQRQELYQQFHSPLVLEAIKTSFWLLPEDDRDLEAWEQAPVDYHRQRLRDRDFLTSFAQQLARRYHTIRAHATLPLTDRARPTIFVIGNTWSTVGRAWLWPLAYSARSLLGHSGDYELVGIFVAAQWEHVTETETAETETETVLERDALTYELLYEGDHLHAGQPWQADLAAAFGDHQTPEQGRFDKIFIVDNVKLNNTTSPQSENDAEIVQLVVDLLEACIQSELLSLIDRCCSVEYPIGKTTLDRLQRYIGVGISSLEVPLGEARELIIHEAATHLLQKRILEGKLPSLTNVTEQITKEIQGKIRELVADSAKATLADNPADVDERHEPEQHAFTLRKTYIVEQARKDPEGTITTKLVITTKQSRPTMFVGISQVSLHVQWTDPLSEEEYLETTNKRIVNEYKQIEQLATALSETLRNRKRQHQYVHETTQIIGQAIGTQLETGDQGLLRALTVAEEVCQRLDNAINEVEKVKRKQQAALDRHNRRWRSVQRVDPLSQLQGVVKLIPRVPALLLRVILIGIVLWQFYYDGLRNGIIFWPFDFWFASPDNGPALASPIAVFNLFALTVGLLAMITLLPWLIARLYLYNTRRHLMIEMRMRIQQALIDVQRSILVLVRRQLDQYLQNELKPLKAELARLKEQIASDIPDNNYQVYPVVDPTTVAQTFREDTFAAIEQDNQQLVSSWLAAPDDPDQVRPELQTQANRNKRVPIHASDSDQVWPKLQTAEKVFEQIKEKLGHMVKGGQYVRPISAYLAGQNLEEWSVRINKASVPWIKVSPPQSAMTLSGDHQTAPVEMMCLIAPEGSANPTALQIAKMLGFCELASWADPYRIMLVRIIGNLTTAQFARWSELQKRKALARVKPATESAAQPSAATASSDAAAQALTEPAPLMNEGGQAMSIPFTYVELIDKLDELLKAERAAIEQEGDKQAEIDLKGVEDAVNDLRKIGSDQRDPTQIARELKNLDYIANRPTIEDRVRQLLKRMYYYIDGWLKQNGIVPILPKRGDYYDPKLHGKAVDREPDPSLPDSVIKTCIRRGYMQIANKRMFIEPLVVVVHNEQ